MANKTALVVGGGNGIGAALTARLLKQGYSHIYVLDKTKPCLEDEKIEFVPVDLRDCDFSMFQAYKHVDTLIITAGFGRPALFSTFADKEIENGFRVNALSPIRIIRQFYDRLAGKEDFSCVVMGSIAGLVSSPAFSVYAATKAAVCRFIESVNIELLKSGTKNRILNVSPGSLRGTRFNGGENDLSLLEEVADTILDKMEKKETLYIPDYDSIYKGVLERYRADGEKFGAESYDYKMQSGRINNRPQMKIGYLSGTFDLFHVGHLNLLRRAKAYCDYLVVGVHHNGSHKGKETFIPYDERVEILKSIKYVDKVIPSKPEDVDVYNEIPYHYLFVGSDYKGTERFMRYEEYFKDKDVEIIYFPYTQKTSSTKIREAIVQKTEKK
ncbi:MAG: SDR family NAD(P)-dependent oxidoreductase [Clostridia bacterium]|nr:SDR family NAD(P)-dependent oxidoreductase [Clostridia bacterium]